MLVLDRYVYFESGWLYRDDYEHAADRVYDSAGPPVNTSLTPIGQLHVDLRQDIARIGGSLGVHQTPICFLMDFFAGWTPPRQLNDNQNTVWEDTPEGGQPFGTGEVGPNSTYSQPWWTKWGHGGGVYRTATGATLPCKINTSKRV